MELNLSKPIVFFDLETTGVNVGKDRIIEICMIKIFPDGREQEKTMRINPGVQISEYITELTGITNSDLADKPTFSQAADEIKEFIGDADLAGYNSNKFDVPLLMEEFLRAGTDFSLLGRNLVDVQNIFHKMESRTLVAAYKYYCKKDLLDAHSAAGDTRATLEVLKAQLDMYKDADYKDKDGRLSKPVVNDMKELARFSKTNNWADLVGHIYLNDSCVECFNFGKHKDKPVAEVFKNEPSYYDWMMKSDFPLTTKEVITRIYQISRGLF
ncbi:MAG: 3'-5' exonuclease [Bacteroidales bacterium]|nr:3'-5' exonuclease [Bacteroidales bacterium]